MAALSLGACVTEPVEPIACTTEAVAGIVVEVVDYQTRSPVAEGSVLTLRDGTYVEESTEVLDGKYLVGAWERAGTYDVRIDREGYAPWWFRSITVENEVCHVVPVSLYAPIVRIEQP